MKALLISTLNAQVAVLVKNLEKHCPKIEISEIVKTETQFLEALATDKPDLIFIDAELFFNEQAAFQQSIAELETEIILLSTSTALAVRAIKYKLCGYLLLPLSKQDLIEAYEIALHRITHKKQSRQNQKFLTTASLDGSHRIGIPTIDGFDFFSPTQIVRCEGYQNCTRIITSEKSDIISSYNIGVFRRTLENFGFYSPHKSHLINLVHVRKYHKEGTIYMSDQSTVPVSKRRKSSFLDMMLPVR